MRAAILRPGRRRFRDLGPLALGPFHEGVPVKRIGTAEGRLFHGGIPVTGAGEPRGIGSIVQESRFAWPPASAAPSARVFDSHRGRGGASIATSFNSGDGSIDKPFFVKIWGLCTANGLSELYLAIVCFGSRSWLKTFQIAKANC